jgi:hypothetical protein
MQTEKRGVQQLSFWTVAISVRAVAQKLQQPRSFPRGVLRGSHIFPFLFFMKKVFRNFSLLWRLVSQVISLFSHIILSRPKSMSPPMPISPLSPKLSPSLGLSLSSQSLFMGPINGCNWFNASERQPSWSLFMFWKDTSISLVCS